GIGVFLASLSLACAYIPSVYYLNEKCNTQIQFSNDVRIKLTRYSYTNLRRSLNCQITISTRDVSDKLLLRFRSLDTRTSFGCTTNKLSIYDTNGNILSGGGICGGIRPSKVYETTGSSLKLLFNTDSFTRQTGNFDVLITSFNNGNRNGSCFAGDYRCENKRCIYNGLTCDGYNNCGDDSDEIDGCGLSKGVFIGIGIGGFVFLVLIILGIICGRRRYYHHHCHGPTITTTTKSYQNF
ncbi:hypothetical protein LOTGIDRAFT_235814, partial [Lottia gigantea]